MYYKAVLNGSCLGQDIRNILYYREGLGLTWTNPFFRGAETLASCLIANVWPKLKVFLPNDYTLNTVDIYPLNEAFEFISSQPYSVNVDEAGANAGAHAGMAPCVNFRFTLEPTGLMNGVWPPKRGYIALGPIVASWVGEDGFIPAATLSTAVFTDVGDALAADQVFVVPTPGSFYPIRVRTNRLPLGIAQWSSYADVSACAAQARVSYRRSRMPER